MNFASKIVREDVNKMNKQYVAGYEDAHCQIGDYIYPQKAVGNVLSMVQGSVPVALHSAPGFGKSHFATKALPMALEEIYGRKFAVIYSVPFALKCPSDIFVRPSLENNSLVWEHTWPIKKIKAAKKRGHAILYIIEEYTRMPPSYQNMHLELLNSMSIHIEQTGEKINLPEYSKILLIGNPVGTGVSQIVEALSSRIIAVDWPMPGTQTIAQMMITAMKNINPVSKRATSFGVKLAQRELTMDVALAIAEAALSMNKYKKDPVSLRDINKCASLYVNSGDNNLAADRMFHNVLSVRLVDNGDPLIQARKKSIQNELIMKLNKFAFAGNG